MDDLIRQRDDLKKKLRELDDLAETGNEKILNAIKSQRWFFFENNKYILFDRDTALIWANLDFFPYRKENTGVGWYSNPIMRIEVKSLIENINSRRWGGFNSWQIPRGYEFAKMIYDNTFPFQEGLKFYIKNENRWCIADIVGRLCTTLSNKVYWFAGINIPTDESTLCGTFVIPCSYALMPEKIRQKKISAYKMSGMEGYNAYNDLVRIEKWVSDSEVLDIFTRNNLIPKFNDYSAAQTYKKLYVDKVTSNRQRILNQISELERKIDAAKKFEEEERRKRFEEEQRKKLEASKPKLFDYKPILAKYDTAAVDKSVIKYFEAVLNITDELLNVLHEYETTHKKTISESLNITLKLRSKYIAIPQLTPEENSLLAERQKFLLQRLNLGTDEVKAQILSVKAQAEELSARLDEINHSGNFIEGLAELEAKPRASFELIVENLARMIRDAQKKVEFFTEHKDLVASVVNSQAAWTDSYKAFKTSLRDELSAACREDSVDEEIFSAWYEDWQKKRFAIEERFLPLVEFALKGNLLDSLDGVLKILGDYRDSVDKFYLHERKNIYQKFAFTAGGDLQEKFETESELYKLSEKLQRDLQEIIFSLNKTEERIFLLRWAEPLLNISIDEISNFIRDKELDAISEEVLTQFAELRRQNFTAYIADSKSYGEAVQRREKEFNALIFRMRKELHKS